MDVARRIFVDANVLFSAVHSASGFARDLIDAGDLVRIDLVTSTYVLIEVRRNLAKKSPAELTYLSVVIAAGVLSVTDPDPLDVEQVAEVIEPKDAPVVAAAVAAGATILATYDRKHLLNRAEEIRRLFDLAVMTPEEIMRSLSSDT